MKDIETSFTKNDDPTNRGLPNTLATTRSTESASLSPVDEKRMVLNSLLAGSVAGISSTIACHPFDVLRVKMQSSAPVAMSAAASAGSATTATATATRAIGLVETVRNMLYYGGGIRAFYTGLAMPLVAQAVYKGTIFTVNNVTESYIRAWKTRESHNAGGFESPYKLTLADRFLSGFMGGAVNAALFCTPVEFVRNQQIAQIENTNTTATATATATTTHNKKSNRRRCRPILLRKAPDHPAVIRKTHPSSPGARFRRNAFLRPPSVFPP